MAAASDINYLFECTSFGLFAINVSHEIVAFTVMGLILGAVQA